MPHVAVTARLTELGLTLPEVAPPKFSYVPAVQTGNLVYCAGQVPFVDGVIPATGKVGAEISIEQGAELARICAINAIAAIGSVVDLDTVTRIVRVMVYVASAPDFTGQAQVGNGASDVIIEVFGDKGRHARSAVGVAVLPLDAPTEVEILAEVG